jgi:hypothetical protein
MSALLALCSLLLIGLVMFEGFETMLLPRRVTRSFRFTRYFYVLSWRPWRAIARRVPPGRRRESLLSAYGPLSIVVLFGLWAAGLIIGFAVLHQAISTPLNTPGGARDPLDYLYMSGVTFFTLGFGDVTPASPPGRMIAVLEAGIGFGFLAAVLGYLPVLYAAFSRREVTISLLDARAGSPPTAAQALLRIGPTRHADTLGHFFKEWERWAAEVLESHLSFPVLSYYRSQHDNQSWLAGLATVLDTCTIVIARLVEVDPYQAQLTFAMARHAVVDLSQIYSAAPLPSDTPRLTEEGDLRLVEALRASGFEVRDDERAAAKFAELRATYEPFLDALARHFVLRLPPIMPEGAVVDNWQTSAWMQRTAGIGKLALQPVFDDGHEN